MYIQILRSIGIYIYVNMITNQKDASEKGISVNGILLITKKCSSVQF